MYKALIASMLLAATTSLYAQSTPPADADKAQRREQMRQKMKSAHEEARKACEGKKGDEHRSCMQKSFCAKSPDPAKCEARMSERAARHKKRMEEKKSQPAEKK